MCMFCLLKKEESSYKKLLTRWQKLKKAFDTLRKAGIL